MITQLQTNKLTMSIRMKYIAVGILTGILYQVYKNYSQNKPLATEKTDTN